MENFANFIVEYIEKNEIHGIKGWLNQLHAYRWKTKSGIENYSDGLLTTKKFKNESQKILNIPNNDDRWHRHCEDIRKWGGMIHEVTLSLALDYKKSVVFLLNNNPPLDSDFNSLPICGKRIATASKIYYYSDPLRWTIYDSRVGYAFHQLIFEYAKKMGEEPSSLFQEIPLCLPDSQTLLPHTKIKKRKPIYPIPLCGSERGAMASFIWGSYLQRLISIRLNETPIPKPARSLSTVLQWELPHVEMVFFVIGDRKWIDAPDILAQGTPPLQSRKRGDYAGTCPWCGHPIKVRESQKTGELYEGCTNFPACHYKGNRSH
jgi:hypothetical protein